MKAAGKALEPDGVKPQESDLHAHLIATGALSQSSLDRAIRMAREGGGTLPDVLTRLGFISETQLSEALAHICGLPLASRHDGPDFPLFESCLNKKFLLGSRVIPLGVEAHALLLGMVDPFNREAIDAVGFATGMKITCAALAQADFEVLYDRLYGEGKSEVSQISDRAEVSAIEGDGEDVERLKDSASEAPVVRLVNYLVTKAVETHASDIHIEPMDGELRVRYRIDGVLSEIEAPPAHLGPAIVSRIKIMAKLNIAERRLAQDGRTRLAVRGKDVDFRVSTTPTVHGESVVLRILDRGSLTLDFDALGLSPQVQAPLLKALNQPHGILLVTGPTGSGKTTTLYAALSLLNTADRKILTIEDPVEYQLAGINQVQVKPQIGLTFAGALRSFLRQDPDIMMVGEIRDLETAQIAVQAALTGHLILSTLHTNDAASAVTRLLDMGVEDFLLTSTINGIVAQRLVRKLCPTCRVPFEAVPELAGRLRKAGAEVPDGPVILHHAKGCPECQGTGYRGRSSIAEVLLLSDRLRQIVLSRGSASDLQKAALDEGMVSLFADGTAKALAGVTSIEEVFRVVKEA
jgi:general secretion pathway protein E